MNSLSSPLEELEKLEEEIQKSSDPLDTKIPVPIPDPSYLTKNIANEGTATQKLEKYSKEYEDFCRWSALPKEQRVPATALLWEKRKQIPKGYSQYFRRREGFRDKVLAYFWDWMMDMYPDVVFAVYQRATAKKGSDKAAGIFIDLLSKKMNLDKPKMQVQPMILMGIEQDKINKLFTPKGFDSPAIIPAKK